MKSELKEFYALVDELDTAMMTTRQRDGHLRSRAMANQKPAAGADLWFVTMDESPKLNDLAWDPHVNLSYYRDRNREWVSVSGTAVVSRDPQQDPGAVRRRLADLVSRGRRSPARHAGGSPDRYSSGSPSTPRNT